MMFDPSLTSLASQYHAAKSERKSLTSSFKIKTSNVQCEIAKKDTQNFNESIQVQIKPECAERRSFRPSTEKNRPATKSLAKSSSCILVKRRNVTATNATNTRESSTRTCHRSAEKTTEECTIDKGTRHTVESGYKLLNITRPDDNKQRHGLSDGIRVHLVESIKLAGLRKAREKSIGDMVSTLCAHLSEREEELKAWTALCDSIAATAVEKLSGSMLETAATKTMIQSYRDSRRESESKITAAYRETTSLGDDLKNIKSDVRLFMNEFKDALVEVYCTLTKEYSRRLVHISSQYECDQQKALKAAISKHNEEKMHLEARISSLGDAAKADKEKLDAMNDQLTAASIVASEADHEQSLIQSKHAAEYKELNDKLAKAEDEVSRLKDLLDKEKASKQQELDAMEERKNKEFDEIEVKVKRSIQLLTQRKDKEIAEALSRAEAAERVVSELRATMLPVITAAEGSGEN